MPDYLCYLTTGKGSSAFAFGDEERDHWRESIRVSFALHCSLLGKDGALTPAAGQLGWSQEINNSLSSCIISLFYSVATFSEWWTECFLTDYSEICFQTAWEHALWIRQTWAKTQLCKLCYFIKSLNIFNPQHPPWITPAFLKVLESFWSPFLEILRDTLAHGPLLGNSHMGFPVPV